jgi:hypothetical protein
MKIEHVANALSEEARGMLEYGFRLAGSRSWFTVALFDPANDIPKWEALGAIGLIKTSFPLQQHGYVSMDIHFNNSGWNIAEYEFNKKIPGLIWWILSSIEFLIALCYNNHLVTCVEIS